MSGKDKKDREEQTKTTPTDAAEGPYQLCSHHVEVTSANGFSNSRAFVRVRKNGAPHESQEVRSKEGAGEACLQALDQIFHTLDPDIKRVSRNVYSEIVDGCVLVRASVTVERATQSEHVTSVDAEETLALLNSYISAANRLLMPQTERTTGTPVFRVVK